MSNQCSMNVGRGRLVRALTRRQFAVVVRYARFLRHALRPLPDERVRHRRYCEAMGRAFGQLRHRPLGPPVSWAWLDAALREPRALHPDGCYQLVGGHVSADATSTVYERIS